MYSNKENVNILTSLLLEYGVSDAVVCPGSRNAPIVHNLSVCEAIRCRPVTDERSAAFYALGLAIATKRPTVVCVTSGSALLNAMPAVAEAAYQHVPLIVISADRPQQWIDQLDGQTIPQPRRSRALCAQGCATARTSQRRRTMAVSSTCQRSHASRYVPTGRTRTHQRAHQRTAL